MRFRLLPKTIFACLLALLLVPALAAAAPKVKLATIQGSINPASADYLITAIDTAQAEGADALLIELDTPGGLVSSTKDILQAMLNSEVPIVVYVAPRGAWASSAGTFITIAAHVAAMAPGTSIGAAHPVGIGGGDSAPAAPKKKDGEDEAEGTEAEGQRNFALEKAENFLAAYVETIAKERNRNVEWAAKAVRDSVAVGQDEALELNVIDLVAENRRDLLAAIDARPIRVAGEERELTLVGAEVEPIDMSYVQLLFNVIANPDMVVILGMLGLGLLYVEFNSPGLIIPGVSGLVCLILAAIGLQILPFDWVGLLLMLAGIALLVTEVFVTSFGLLFAAGVACLLLGGTMLFDQPELSDLTVSFWSVLVPAVGGMSVFGGIVAFALGRSLWTAQTAGVDELIGLVGRSDTVLDPDGRVFVRGEYWNASAIEPIAAGEPVEIVEVNGLQLRVRRSTR